MAPPVSHLVAATGSAVCNRCAAASISSCNGSGESATASGATETASAASSTGTEKVSRVVMPYIVPPLPRAVTEALTVSVADWSGADYRRVSSLQRAVASETLADLVLDGDERILDIGCGDGFLTREIAGRLPTGFIVGIDPSPRMVAAAGSGRVTPAGPRFVRADARRLPFARCFDMAVSFNALHWVPQLDEALTAIATILEPGGRSLIQMVCAAERPSIESTAMAVAHSAPWSERFIGFSTPFVHPDPAEFADLANACGLRVSSLTVRDREWDFGTGRTVPGLVRGGRHGMDGPPRRARSGGVRRRPGRRLPAGGRQAPACSGSCRCGPSCTPERGQPTGPRSKGIGALRGLPARSSQLRVMVSPGW